MRTKISGFTLLEILTVVAVISILVSLLLPAMSMSRRRVMQVQCQNNLKQIGYAAKTYALDYKSHYPNDGISGKTSLELLTENKYLENRGVLYCPSGNGDSSGVTDFYFAYFLTESSPDSSPLAVDDSANHYAPLSYNVLYLDGHVDRSDGPPQGASAPVD